MAGAKQRAHGVGHLGSSLGRFAGEIARKIAKNRKKRHEFRGVFVDSKDSYSQKPGFEVYQITPSLSCGRCGDRETAPQESSELAKLPHTRQG
jgi:hypothetical protein